MRTISKTLFLPLLLLLAAAWGSLAAHAAMIPQEWAVEVSRIKQYQFEANRGDTMELKATFWHKGEPFDLGGDTFRLYWQTNGMDSVYWSAAAVSASNTVSAVFANTMDPGAPIVYGFLGATSGNYRASFAIRYAPGPGAVPNALPLPAKSIDFAQVEVFNAPWTKEIESLSVAVESNRVNIASNSTAISDLTDTTATLSDTTATINSKIPSAASASNQLADKEWIDDEIDTYAAYYITYTAAGAAFPTRSALTNATVVYSGGAERTPTRNDYAVVLADESHGGAEWRYIYTVAAGATSGQWDAQYPIETNDYDGLSNKPQINGVSLSGNQTGAALGLADETTPVVQPPSLSADLFPIVYQNQFGDTLTIESMADVVFEHPGGAYPYELYKSGFYSRICGFEENGVFAGNGGGTVATFNGRNGENYIWPTLTLSATGGSVVRSTDLVAAISDLTDTTSTLNDSISTINATKADRSELAGYATPADVYRIVAGTNVVLVITNYNSTVHAPSMKLQHLDQETGEYVTYWDEARGHGITLTNAMDYADGVGARLDAAKAPRAWSRTTSGLGADAPEGTTFISTPVTHISSGFEFEKKITAGGTVWTLCSTSLAAGSTTNGFFEISALDGTPVFSVEKTDSVLVGVNASAIAVVDNACVISVPAVADTHPFARVATTLVQPTWYKEDSDGMPAGAPASVTWSGQSGAWVATVDFGAEPQGFVFFEYLQEGGVKIVNSAVVDLSQGVHFNGATYMPTVSGNELKFIRQ